MPKLSDNQQAALDSLINATQDVAWLSKAAWKKACPQGVSVNTAAMLKTGAVTMITAAVSTNGKVIELFQPKSVGDPGSETT